MSTPSRPPRCPICRGEASAQRNPSFPFCSERCQMVDLGRWLNEEYTLPAPLTERDLGALEQLIEAQEQGGRSWE